MNKTVIYLEVEAEKPEPGDDIPLWLGMLSAGLSFLTLLVEVSPW